MKIRNIYRHSYGTASIDKILSSIITKSIWDFLKHKSFQETILY
ncbi:hypothetical protein [Bacillus wiedmannii]|nr:hypothetical protein [Bacillus wiedmannii]